MPDKIKVLVTVGYYLPGYKAGGPLKTIVNLVDQLSDEFEFWILTRDRDLGDVVPYKNMKLNEWVDTGNAKVFYATPDMLTMLNFARLIKQTPCDILYLNSFFDVDFSIKPLFSLKLGLFPDVPVIVAPRGEFSTAALQIKLLKKRIYMQFAKFFSLYQSVIWQASSRFEQDDILNTLADDVRRVLIAKDLPSKPYFVECDENKALMSSAVLRVVFLSRISPMKNLDYALSVLQKVKVPVRFDIYGPIEDKDYWALCERLIETMPENIVLHYIGSVHPNKVGDIFSGYDLFFFPTRGENYGHVIAESLSVGTPVLLSDQTPWRELKNDELGLDLPLADEGVFVRAIENYFTVKVDCRNNTREAICVNAFKRIFNQADKDANKELFLFAINEFG